MKAKTWERATKPISITLTQEDIDDAVCNDFAACAMAQATKKLPGVKDVVIGNKRAHVTYEGGGVPMVHSIPSRTRKVIDLLDSAKRDQIKPGTYTLGVLSPSDGHKPNGTSVRGSRWHKHKSSTTKSGRQKLAVRIDTRKTPTRRIPRAGSKYDPSAGVGFGKGLTIGERILVLFKTRKSYKASEVIKALAVYHIATKVIYQTLSNLVKQGKLVRPASVYHLA
jgi:hypothetical protein